METTLAAVRRFNRFYTRHAGILAARFLGTGLTLAEARVMLEIARRPGCVARDLHADLDMDPAQLSRTVSRFEKRGWLARGAGVEDARRRPLSLTDAGLALHAEVDRRQRARIGAALAPLSTRDRSDLRQAMGTIERLLTPARPDASGAAIALRPFGPGEVSLVIARQAMVYAQEQGWGAKLEALMLETGARFLARFDPAREQCWIAEVDGVLAGSVFLTNEGSGTARLRLLYAEPHARGRGVADRLVASCIGFARERGYVRLILWTHTVLAPARRLYARHGFVLIDTQLHEEFGTPVQGETWEKTLA